MGRRRVRKGIVFIAALEGVLLLLVVAVVALLPMRTLDPEELLELRRVGKGGAQAFVSFVRE